VSLIEFALAMGLWKMKNWARMSTLVLVTVGFISAAASLRHIPVLPIDPLVVVDEIRARVRYRLVDTHLPHQSERSTSVSENRICLISSVGSNGRCNTIWYKAVFKGGVYETRETVWAFSGTEARRVASVGSNGRCNQGGLSDSKSALASFPKGR
jgi:hypothetical protein